ncbi:hypothetical protein LDO31_18070 [Luteimonas sp. XNQY3]|nr:hypothetical protein [Luteimonas sp. XNQY3]MCD9008106.1 hypothetical protein [Luteimonas sp. XNQY3]
MAHLSADCDPGIEEVRPDLPVKAQGLIQSELGEQAVRTLLSNPRTCSRFRRMSLSVWAGGQVKEEPERVRP